MNYFDQLSKYEDWLVELQSKFILCTATHLDKPNLMGTARGRKLHILKDDKKTFCNMLLDEKKTAYQIKNECYSANGLCKNCQNQAKV